MEVDRNGGAPRESENIGGSGEDASECTLNKEAPNMRY